MIIAILHLGQVSKSTSISCTCDSIPASCATPSTNTDKPTSLDSMTTPLFAQSLIAYLRCSIVKHTVDDILAK